MLSAIVKKFPKHAIAAQRLFLHDAAFRNICDDLGAATKACAFWQEDKIRAAEYREVVIELENEIAEILKRETSAEIARPETRFKR